jgi:hypothetical protein
VEASAAASLFADGIFTALIGADFRAELRETATCAAAARAETFRCVAFRLVFAGAFVERLVLTERLFMEQL